MKLTTYTSQLSSSGAATTSSSGSSLVFDKNMYGDGGKSLNAMAGVIGEWAKVVKQKQDEDDQQAAFDAINAYNKQTYSMMYDGDDALMNVTGSKASSIGQSYMLGEQQIRASVLDNVRFHNAKNKQSLENMLDRQALSHFQTVGKREYQQRLVARKETLNLASGNAQLAIQKNYADEGVVATQAAYLASMVKTNFPNMGDEEKSILLKDTLGAYYGAGIQAAINANDTAAYDKLMRAGQGYLSPQQVEKYAKTHTAFVKDETMRKTIRAAVDENKTWAQVEADLRKGTTTDGGRSLVDIMRVDMVNAPYRLNEENSKAFFGVSMKGTSCMATIGFGPLKNTEYSGIYNIDDAIKVAEKNKQLIAGDSGYKPKPGDLAVVNNGNHIVMVTENGTIQNGESGNGGKGGVWESSKTPEQMFGEVKYYIRTSDYNGTVGGGTRPYTEKEIDQYHNMFNAYENQKKHDKTVADLKNFKSIRQYVYDNFINNSNGMVPIDKALLWARQSAGSNYELAEKNVKAVSEWYKIFGVNTTNGRAKIDRNRFDEAIYKFGSLDNVRSWCAAQGFNASDTNWAIDRWQKYFERKGEFSLDEKELKALAIGKTSNLSPAEIAKWNGAKMYIREEAAKIETSTGMPIDPDALALLAKKAGEEKVYGGGWFPNGSLVPYSSGTKMSIAMARKLGFKINADYRNPGAFYVENTDGSSTWLRGEDLAREVEEKAKAIYGK